MKLRFLLAAALTGLASPAFADELPQEFVQRKGVVKLQPSGPWALDFAENKCVLSRQFGDGEDTHLIFFEQAYPDERFGMTLAGPRVRRFGSGRWIRLGMLEDVPMRILSGKSYGSVEGIGSAIIIGNVFIGSAESEDEPQDGDDGKEEFSTSGQIDLEQAQKINRIILKLGTSGLSFETGNMMPPMQALNVCTSDFLRDWGLDVEKHARYQPPKWLNQEVIVKKIQKDYPTRAIFRGEQAIFRMRVIVENDGTVSDCHLEKSTQTEFLESAACETMLAARFEPARDTKGEPMRSFYATSIYYQTN